MLIGKNTITRAVVGKTNDQNYQTFRVDPSTHAIKTIDYPHAEIHGGNLFLASRWDTLASADTIAIAMTTPDSEKEQHSEWEIYGSGAVTLDLFRNVTSYTGGTATTPMNLNDRSDNTSVVTTLAGSDGVLVDPLVITGGTSTTLASIGSGNKGSSDGGSRHEFILAKNEITIFRITAVGNNILCGLDLDWYEHTPKGA